jgi:hypothetical protein
MKKVIVCTACLILVYTLACSCLVVPAFAQFNQAIPDGPLGAPHQPNAVIDLGQVFGVAAPYIDEGVNSLIALAVAWFGYMLQKRFNITIDQGHRDSLTRALQNQANSLIADGAVELKGKTVTVHDGPLLDATTEIMKVVPDAVKRFGITPEYLAKRIVDTIPQTPAGATMVASAHAAPQTGSGQTG